MRLFRIHLSVITLLAALTAFTGCHSGSADGHDHESSGNSTHETSEEGEADEIVLAPDKAERLGVKVTEAVMAPVDRVITVTGEVIADPSDRAVVTAPSAGSVTFAESVKVGDKVGRGKSIASVSSDAYAGGDANRAARIRMESAKRELDRIEPLVSDGIVTRSQYNAALQEYELARAAVGSRGQSATAPISGTVTEVFVANGQYVEAGAPIAAIATDGAVVVRADIPRRHARTASASTALIRIPYSGDTLRVGSTASPASAAANGAYIPAYFSAGASSGLTPGSYVEVLLSSPTGQEGISLPVSAFVERMGKHFVYVRVDDECYERRPVKIGGSDGINSIVTEGVDAGDMVVTDGVTYLRLAETSGNIPEGHHH